MISKALENLKIKALNPMQLESMAAIKKGGDIILLSPTGSGKTLAFLLPIAEKLSPEIKGVQALVLVPSRELAIQIEQVFKSLQTGFKVNCCYGGHDARTEKSNLLVPPALLIGTPGRIASHLEEGRINPETVSMLVLDEFDKSLEFGFKGDMSFIIEKLSNLNQHILTSATNAIEIPDFTGVKDPVTIDYLVDQISPALKLKAVVANSTDKLMALFSLICKLGNKSTLVFCNHRDAVDRISELLSEKGIVHDVFHGGMEQIDRERALIKFRNGSHKILVTTDLAARGIDIPEIENIIHYQLPPHENAFVHRNGRTARMHAEGTSYLILSDDEKQPDYIKEKPQVVGLPSKNILPPSSGWTTLYIGAGKKEKINKMDIVGLILQKGKLNKDELGLIEVLDHSSYAAVKSERIEKMLALVKAEKIKGKKVKMEIAR